MAHAIKMVIASQVSERWRKQGNLFENSVSTEKVKNRESSLNRFRNYITARLDLKLYGGNNTDSLNIISIHSFSKKAYPWDNACIESFHSLIKREWLNRFKIKDYEHAHRLVSEYIESFYNTVRIHSHCDYMSPTQFEKLYQKTLRDGVNAS